MRLATLIRENYLEAFFSAASQGPARFNLLTILEQDELDKTYFWPLVMMEVSSSSRWWVFVIQV